MRILHLTTELPYFPGGPGGSTRQYFLLRRLVQRGHQVVVIAPAPPSRLEHSDAAALAARAGIDLRIVLRPENRVREATLSALHEPSTVMAVATRPWLAWRASVFTPQARPVIAHAARELAPDLVSVEHDHLAHWSELVDLPVPRVLMTQNASWMYHASRARAATSWRQRAWAVSEAARFRAYVRRWLPRYQLVTVTSQPDASAVRRYFDGDIRVIANGADCSSFTPTPVQHDPPTLLFTGTLYYPPNVEGIVWFAHNAWRRVLEAVPTAQLAIVGQQPAPEVLALTELPNVRVVASVPDMRPWFRDCTAVVVPLRSGGGTRLKVIEALACGRAVVSTTVGAEGLGLEHGHELLLADSSEAFAAAATRLLTDRVLNERLARSGRRAATARFDWSALGDELEAALRDLVR